MLNILNIENNQIDIGELVLENNKSSELDSIKRAREAEEKKDPRLTKWYYVFNQNYFYEYRLGVGWRFESKIIKNNIYKFDKPFYEILSLKGDTLEIKEHLSKKSLLLKRVNTNLDGLEIISEH